MLYNKFLVALALSTGALGSALAKGGNKNAGKQGVAGATGAASSSSTAAAAGSTGTTTTGGAADLALNPANVQTGSQADGAAASGAEAGQAASATYVFLLIKNQRLLLM